MSNTDATTPKTLLGATFFDHPAHVRKAALSMMQISPSRQAQKAVAAWRNAAKRKRDTVRVSPNLTVDVYKPAEPVFRFHGKPILHVYEPSIGETRPRGLVTLAGDGDNVLTVSTKANINNLCAELGLAFYCWTKDGTPWAIWRDDGDVYVKPLDVGDYVYCTR